MSDENTGTRPDLRLLRMAKSSLEKGFKPFLSDFNPETSEREKRKLNQRINGANTKKRALYNEMGIFVETGQDLCDCLETRCPGCHYPCPKCKSTKCGHECRSNREWSYISITACESDKAVVKNFRYKP